MFSLPPPSSPIDIKKLDHLINQLPKPFIVMGDFNSHHTLWGCTNTNDKGRIIEDFITKHDLVLLNDKSSTYLHPATGSYSSLDLTICSPGIFPDFNWKVVDDLHGSDLSRSRYRKLDFQYNNVLNVGNFIKQTGNSLEFIANRQSIPMPLKIVKILLSFSLPYFILLLKSQFLELRQILSTQTNHGLMMNANRL